MYLLGSLDFLKKEDQENLILSARNYEYCEEFIREIGWEPWMEEFTEVADDEIPSERELENITKVLKEAFEKAHKEIPMARQLRDLAKMKRVDFCEKYGIPLRTMEDWEAGKSKAPQYVMDLLERAVRQDMGMQSLYYVFEIIHRGEMLVDEEIHYKGYNIIEAKRIAKGIDGEVEIRRYYEDIEDEDCNNFDYEVIDF